MKKWIALCLCALLACSFALAEDTVAALDGSDTVITPIAMDDYTVHGGEPDASAYTESTYSDASITVEMSREWVGDACFNVAHVTIAHASQIRTALAGKLGKKTNYVWNIAANNAAVVAIGGEDLAENTGTYTIRQTVTERKKGYAARDTLVIDQNGDFHVYTGFDKSILTDLEAQGLQAVNLFNFGPILVKDGELQTVPSKYGVGNPSGTEPRTAIGQVGPLEYILVVVDGRNVKDPTPDGGTKASKGTDMQTVAQYLYDAGCVQAYALDGGGSAVMTFGTETYSNPSSKRGVSDIIYFASAVGE